MSFSTRCRTGAVVAALAMLAGCVAAPVINKPEIPAGATGAFMGTATAPVDSRSPPDEWWRLYRDPQLDRHVERALHANADLRVAVANLDGARAAVREADAARWPATVVESGVGPDRADRQPSTSSVPKTSYELGVTAGYEVDLFGRVRGMTAAAVAEAAASEALRDAARLAVAGDTVAAYLDYCAAGVNSKLLARQIDAQQRAYALVSRQLELGEVSPLEVNQVQLLRDRLQAAVPQIETDRTRSLIRLAILQGVPPAQAQGLATDCTALPRLAVPLPVGDGASLLARRPDVREAEQRLAVVTARAQVVHADLYPRIQLGGSAGLIAGGVDAVLTPLITWSFPNQSAARARVAAASSAGKAALASWDRVVLTALGEVETSLADFRAEHQRQAALAAIVTLAEQAAARSQTRVRLGADSHLLVLDSERARIEAEMQLQASQTRLAQIEISLFRALGGGWQESGSMQ